MKVSAGLAFSQACLNSNQENNLNKAKMRVNAQVLQHEYTFLNGNRLFFFNFSQLRRKSSFFPAIAQYFGELCLL